jgi:hypothetical protein
VARLTAGSSRRRRRRRRRGRRRSGSVVTPYQEHRHACSCPAPVHPLTLRNSRLKKKHCAPHSTVARSYIQTSGARGIARWQV